MIGIFGGTPSAAKRRPAAATPTLGVSPSTLDVSASAQTFTLTGSNLSGDATVTAPSGFQVSLNGASYGASQTVTPSSGTISGQTVYVRRTPPNTTDASGNAACSASGATTKNVAIAYTGAL